jgi:hypothetical protein
VGGLLRLDSLSKGSDSGRQISLNSIDISSELLYGGQQIGDLFVCVDLTQEDRSGLEVQGSGFVCVALGVHSVLVV